MNMDIESPAEEQIQRKSSIFNHSDKQFPQKRDILEEMFFNPRDTSIISQKSIKSMHHKSAKFLHQKQDLHKFLNSSSSNERLVPPYMNFNSSRQNSEQDNHISNENSVSEESFRKEFRKRYYEESFSVENTIRDSSSSFSQRSDSKSLHSIIPKGLKEQMLVEEEEQKPGCSCKKSKCLKTYCDCFKNRTYCSKKCNCLDCGNHSQNNKNHDKAVIEALSRNPNCFESTETELTFSLNINLEEVKKGCKCKKTHCLKKYCECYHNGLTCGVFCKCENCYNTQSKGMRKSMMEVESNRDYRQQKQQRIEFS